MRGEARDAPPIGTRRLMLLVVLAMVGGVAAAVFVGAPPDREDSASATAVDASPTAVVDDDGAATNEPCTVATAVDEDATGSEAGCVIQRLAELGYDVDSTSDRFDPRAVAALREFQRETGLAVDGIAGPATLTQLQLWPGSTGSMVIEGGQVFTVDDGLAALTFDDGPGAFTGPVLDVLADHSVPATFFVVGNGVAGNETTLTRILDDGHSLQSHTWNHPKLRELTWAEIETQLTKTSDAVEAATGHRPTCYRPPHGATNAHVRTVAGRIDLYPEILWNVDPRDFRPSVTAAELVDISLANADGRGLIIGFHDGGNDRSSTVEALPEIISGLEDRGYEFVTLCD